MRNNILLDSDCYESLKNGFTYEELGKVCKAVLDYGFERIEPNYLSGPLYAVYKLIAIKLEKSQNKYDSCLENGKKGGAPKGNRNARKKQPKTTEKQPEIQSVQENIVDLVQNKPINQNVEQSIGNNLIDNAEQTTEKQPLNENKQPKINQILTEKQPENNPKITKGQKTNNPKTTQNNHTDTNTETDTEKENVSFPPDKNNNIFFLSDCTGVRPKEWADKQRELYLTPAYEYHVGDEFGTAELEIVDTLLEIQEYAQIQGQIKHKAKTYTAEQINQILADKGKKLVTELVYKIAKDNTIKNKGLYILSSLLAGQN